MWETIRIPRENAICFSKKSVLIKMPLGCEYEDYKFWHPIKLCEPIGDDEFYLLYNKNFVFKIFRGKKEKNEIKIIESMEVGADVILESFKEIIDGLEVHIPPQLEPERTEAIKELLYE